MGPPGALQVARRVIFTKKTTKITGIWDNSIKIEKFTETNAIYLARGYCTAPGGSGFEVGLSGWEEDWRWD